MSKKKKSKKVKFSGSISKTRAMKIFEALGFKTANQWDVPKLEKKVKNLPNLVEGVELNPKMQKRVNAILRAINQGQTVRVVDVIDAPTDAKREQEVKDAGKREAKRKVEKKAKDKKKAKADVKKTVKKAVAKKQAKKAVASKEKKSGVIMSVLEFVKEGKPISEKQILARLKQRFPDKNPESMERTVPRIPGYLASTKDIDVIGRNDKGLFIIKKK